MVLKSYTALAPDIDCRALPMMQHPQIIPIPEKRIQVSPPNLCSILMATTCKETWFKRNGGIPGSINNIRELGMTLRQPNYSEEFVELRMSMSYAPNTNLRYRQQGLSGRLDDARNLSGCLFLDILINVRQNCVPFERVAHCAVYLLDGDWWVARTPSPAKAEAGPQPQPLAQRVMVSSETCFQQVDEIICSDLLAMLSQWYCLDYVIAVPQCLGGGFGRSIKQLNATPPWCPLWIIGAARAPSTPPNHTQALTFRWLARAALRMEHADRPAGGSETVFTSNNLNFKLFSGGRSMRTAVDVPLAQDESRYGIVPETDAEAAAAMQRANGIQANIATQSAQSTGAQPSKAQSSSSCFASVIKDERLVTRAHSVQLSFLEARRSISEGNDRAIMITAARSQSPSSSFNPASRVSHSHFNSYDMTDRRRGGGTNSILSRPIFRKSSDESLGS
ncbi:hypothetical protein BDR06DRAFT_977732, partial [Suillus hirtellus]